MSSLRRGPDTIQDQSIDICGRQSGTGRGFSPSLSLYQYCIHILIYELLLAGKIKGGSLGPFQKSVFLRKSRGTGLKFSLFFRFRRVKVKLN